MHPYLRRRHRKERENRSRFTALIAVPATGVFTMPANGRIRFVAAAGAIEGDTAATMEGATARTIRTPALSAGGYVKLDNVERDTVVTVKAGFEAQVDLGLGKWATIAEGA